MAAAHNASPPASALQRVSCALAQLRAMQAASNGALRASAPSQPAGGLSSHVPPSGALALAPSGGGALQPLSRGGTTQQLATPQNNDIERRVNAILDKSGASINKEGAAAAVRSEQVVQQCPDGVALLPHRRERGPRAARSCGTAACEA